METLDEITAQQLISTQQAIRLPTYDILQNGTIYQHDPQTNLYRRTNLQWNQTIILE